MEVVYEGIRLTPAQIAALRARRGRPRHRPVDPVGLAPRADPGVVEALRDAGVGDVPVVVGGIIPVADEAPLKERRRRRGLHAEGLRPHAHHARRRRLGGRAQRHRGRGVSDDLAARLRDGDLRAAPAVLNLVENRSPAQREEIAGLLRGGLPRRARRRGARPRGRHHRSAGGGQVDAAERAGGRVARHADARSRCWPSTRRPSARAARCWAIARGSSTTPRTRACSSARPPRGRAWAVWPRRRGRRPARWPPRSTWWSSRPSGSASPRPRWPRWPTRSR